MTVRQLQRPHESRTAVVTSVPMHISSESITTLCEFHFVTYQSDIILYIKLKRVSLFPAKADKGKVVPVLN
jgi:hypothetical protein